MKHVAWNMPLENSRPMIAKMTIQKKTSRAMFMRGAIAFKMDERTTCKLGTPFTSFSGRSTLNARKILRSKPMPSLDTNTVSRPDVTTTKSMMFHRLCR